MAAIDWSNPCARYAALRDAYFQHLSGGAETLIRYRGPEGEREVRYGAQNLVVLQAEMNAAQAECAALNGTPNPGRRSAIRLGAQRRRCF